MDTFAHLQVPIGATRLRSSSPEKGPDALKPYELKPAPKITVSLPNPTPPSSPTTATKFRSSLLSSAASTVSSPATAASSAISMIPQLLLSTSLSPMTPSGQGSASGPTALNPRKRLEPYAPTLLSSKDPLSLPIMTNNFKRFVMTIGPVFWLQDRIEEVVLWKKGWMWTMIWMAGYALLCTGRGSFKSQLLNWPYRLLSSIYTSAASCSPYWGYFGNISVSLEPIV
jgi:hypothetical protein